MFEILKQIQETPTSLLIHNLDGYSGIQFIKFDHEGPGSLIVRHEDQPYADFSFLPGDENVVSVPTACGGIRELVGVRLTELSLGLPPLNAKI